MSNPRRHWGETLAGIGASGVELILGYVDGYPLAGHPLGAGAASERQRRFRLKIWMP